jgi:hypothetical protein
MFFLSFWGSSKKFVWSFTSEEMGYVFFFMWLLKLFVCIFSSIFFLSFWGSLIFRVKFHKGGYKVFDFFLGTSKVFCFSILKFWSFQFSSCHFGGL